MDDMNFNNLDNNNTDNNIPENSYVQNNENVTASDSSAEGGFANSCYTGDPNPVKSSPFYTESYKKPAKRHNSLFQLVAVALVSSILGGAVVGGFFQFVTPVVQPTVKGYFDKLIPGTKTSGDTTAQQNNAGAYKQVEIVQGSDSAITTIAEKVGPSIVGIRVTEGQRQVPSFGFFGFGSSGPQTSEGSGIIVKDDGYIMTNNHVIEGAINSNTGKMTNGAKIEVFLPSQKDKPYEASVVGFDQKTDLAVIKITATGLPVAELGNSDTLKVGELAVAIGNPGGMEYMGSVTVGIISGLNRTIPVEDGKELKLVQTDAAINPGNSGGALINSKGQVIGVNTAKIAEQGFEGLGFAIPINKAKEIIDSLIQFKYVKGRPFLGISPDTSFDEEMAKQYDVPAGILVAKVTPLSGAQKGGIQAGDIITKFDGKPVKTLDELNTIKNTHKPGDTVAVTIYRDGETKTLQIKLTEENAPTN